MTSGRSLPGRPAGPGLPEWDGLPDNGAGTPARGGS